MASPALSARLRFLNESAHLLALSAPVTSRHLMSRVNSIIFENNLEPPKSHGRQVCGACGTLMIIEMGVSIGVEPEQPLPQRRKRKRKAGSALNTTKREKVLVYTCGACGRYTRHALGVPPMATQKFCSKSKTADPEETINSVSLMITKTTSSASSTSKKRTKSRKHSGLEAILARQKAVERASSGFGLNLMDFLK